MATLESSEEFWARIRAEDEGKKRRGEKCSQCGDYITSLRPPGHSQRCFNCRSLDRPESVIDNRYIRCPACGFNWDPLDNEGDVSGWDNSLLEHGDHTIGCPRCGHTFEVTTRVSYTFDSPALVAEEAADGDG
jgi:DNA-directed RNA polymerase subunit RPC12/RpoP